MSRTASRDLLRGTKLGSQGGCYSLIIALRRKKAVRVGRLGVAVFPKGTYVYTGSAKGGLAARLRRHLRRKKKLHWHIDYLLTQGEARIEKIVLYSPAPDQECRQNQKIAGLQDATVILRNLGASDCKAGCASHLFFLGQLSDSRLCQPRLEPFESPSG